MAPVPWAAESRGPDSWWRSGQMSAAGAVYRCSNKQVCYFKAPLFWPKLRLKYKLNKSRLVTWLKLLPLLSFSGSLNLRGTSVPLILVPTHVCLAPLSSRVQQGHMHDSWWFVGVCCLPSAVSHIQLQLQPEQLLTRTQPVWWSLRHNIQGPDHAPVKRKLR